MPYDPFTGSWYDDDRSSSIGTGTYRYNPFDDLSSDEDALGSLRSSYGMSPYLSSEEEDAAKARKLAEVQWAMEHGTRQYDEIQRGLVGPETAGEVFTEGVLSPLAAIPAALHEGTRNLMGGLSSGLTYAGGMIQAPGRRLAEMTQGTPFELIGGAPRVLTDPIGEVVNWGAQPLGRMIAPAAEVEAPEVQQILGQASDAGPVAKFGVDMATQIPQFAAMAAAQLAGVPAPMTASALGVSSAGNAIEGARYDGAGYQDAMLRGLASGLAESGGELLGTLRIVERAFGPEAAAVAQNAWKSIAGSMGREYATEFATSLAQQSAELATGAEPRSFEDVMQRAAYEGGIAAPLGGVMAAAGVAANRARPPLGSAIPPEAMAPAAPPVDPTTEMAATMAAMPQDIPTQQVPMAGDASTQLLPQAPFDPTSQIPPEMLNDPTLPAPEEQIPTQQMTGPLPTEPSLQRTEIAPQEIPVEQYVPEAVRRDIEEARALLAQQRLDQTKSDRPDTLRFSEKYLARNQPFPQRAKVAELMPQLEAQENRNRRIEQAMDETTDGRAPVEQAPAAAPVQAPFPPPRKAPTPKAPPVAEVPLEATVDEPAPKMTPATVPAQRPGKVIGRGVLGQWVKADRIRWSDAGVPEALVLVDENDPNSGHQWVPFQLAEYDVPNPEDPGAGLAATARALGNLGLPSPVPIQEVPKSTQSSPAAQSTPSEVPAEALGIKGRVLGGLEEALENVGPVLKKWGTSLGVLTRPARSIIEMAKGSRTAKKDTALEIGNAITRLTVREVKAGRWKRAELDAAINAYLDGETPSRPLPEEIQKAADAARAIVMPLQRRQAAVLRAQGRGDLAKVFQSNVGRRHTRAYRVFDDPKHVAKLRKTGEWERIKEDIKKLPEMAGKSDDEVEAFMQEMTDRDPLSLDLRKGSGLGTAYEGIYKQRQEIPEPIRKLLGEYTEPGERIFRTVDRLQRNVGTYEMYSDLRKIGLKEGWLSEKPTKGVYKLIPGESSRNPIGGLYASPDMHEIITSSDPELMSALILKALQWGTGAVKANKTVLSIQSQNRNIEGNVLLHAGNGNFLGARFLPWNRRKGALPIGVRMSFRELARTSSGRGTVKDILKAKKAGALQKFDPLARRRQIEEAIKYGIFDQNPDVKDIEFFFGPDGPLNPKKSFGAKSLEELKRYAQHLYRLGDGGYKFDAWQQEQNRLAWIHEGDKAWTPERIKAVAADHVRDTYPTSDRQPKWVQGIRRQPVIGGFISFYLDIPRVAKNVLKLGLGEIAEGRKVGNTRMQQVGYHRVASLAAGTLAMEGLLLGLKAARSAFSKKEDKPKRDEELMFRPFLPEYMHNARTPVLVRGKGWAVISDMSFMDPWAMLKRPIVAMMRSMVYDEEGIDRAIWEGLQELAGPVAQQGLVIGPMAEAFVHGADQNGRRIWYEKEKPSTKIMKSMVHLAKRWEPGTATTMKRLGKALASGDLRAVGTEAVAVVGPRFMLMEMDRQLPILAGRYAQNQRDATSVFHRTLRPDKDEDERKAEFRNAVDMYEATAKDLVAAIETARELNLSRDEIERLLGNSSISKKTIALAFEGEDALVKAYREKLRENYNKFRKNPRGWRDD